MGGKGTKEKVARGIVDCVRKKTGMCCPSQGAEGTNRGVQFQGEPVDSAKRK